VLAVLALLLTSSTAAAVRYGNIEVVVESEPRGTATHGYAEIWVRVQNHSDQATHTVRVAYPKSSYNPGGDYLRSVSRTVSVEAGKVARVALAYPERVAVAGSGLSVAIDGSEQDDPVPLSSSGSGRGFGYRGYGYGGSYGSTPQPLILYSRSVDTNFPDWVNQARLHIRGGPVPGVGGPAGAGPAGGPPPPVIVGPGMPFTTSSSSGSNIECVRADQPATAWSPNWLSYTRYDGVVVTADDLRTMPAEVRTAVAQYAECGGSLLVLGGDPPLPGRWPSRPYPGQLKGYAAGFGECLVLPRTNLQKWPPAESGAVLDSWSRTQSTGQREQSPAEAHRSFPVVEDVSVPVKGLLVLMFLFAVVIGPLNLFFLARRQRKLWQFWTVPLVSFVTCLSVFAYMAVTEGWQGRVRAEGFTVLDENTRRAATIGWTGYYTPMLSGGGLHFSPATEVAYQNGDDRSGGYYRRRRSGSALTLDWTRDQHLASGWVTPRVPSTFAFRKAESRRERVTFTKGADGRPEAVNGLGADLTELWYSDEKGNLFRAANVPAGGRAALDPAPAPATAASAVPSLREVYTGDWATVVNRMQSAGPALLTPRTYLAVMDAAPFLDDAAPGASVRKVRSVVLGILREGGDEG
jgi:hypothetical protein